MEALTWFKDLPTKGKVAVAAGGAGVLLLVWRPWAKKAAPSIGGTAYSPAYTGAPSTGGSPMTPSTPRTLLPELPGVVPTTPTTPTPVAPITPTTPSSPPTIPGSAQPTPPPSFDWAGFLGNLVNWNTTPTAPAAGAFPTAPAYPKPPIGPAAPTLPYVPPKTPVMPGTSPLTTIIDPRTVIQQVNDYMRINANADISTVAALHQQKQQAANSLGYTLTSDGFILDPNTGQYAPGINQTGSESAAAMAIHGINQYVASNYYKLTADQVGYLHDQKVAAAQSLGYSVDANGEIFDSSGNQVAGVGWSTTPIANYHNAAFAEVAAPVFFPGSAGPSVAATQASPMTSGASGDRSGASGANIPVGATVDNSRSYVPGGYIQNSYSDSGGIHGIFVSSNQTYIPPSATQSASAAAPAPTQSSSDKSGAVAWRDEGGAYDAAGNFLG